MAAEKNKEPGAITQAPAAGTSTAVHHKAHKGPSVKEQFGQAFDYVKKNTPRGTGIFLGIAVVVVLVVLLFRYFYLSSEATASERWLRLNDATYLSEIEAIAADPDLKDTEQARTARLLEARMKLDAGLKSLGSSRDQALKDIESARVLYTELGQATGRSPLVQQEALWGAAKANESLGEVKAAEDLYQRLVKEHASSAFGKDAKKQLDRLADPNAKKDLEELAEELGLKKPG